MEYQALYRKYRPQRFDEVIGQDHVTKTLAREVVEGRVAHAYLFAGPRGTGKTTCARLLAKALNCASLAEDGEPDNECASCLGIAEGTSLDVIELDAASHNKVEDIREIRINVGTVAAGAGARRIYILDEAHMLSRAAGNALLKTLEEPPEHVIFVLATTEPYKLLDTIRSRSQRFDFHPVATETLVDYLEEISSREGFSPEPNGLATVAAHSGGSVRDALSLLEQVAALGGGTVSSELAGRALGLADSEAFGALATALQQQDAPAALGLVARLASQGADLRRFVSESIGFFRGVFLAQYAPNLEEVADEPMGTLEEWRRHAKELTPAEVLRAVDLLGEALQEVRQGREERLVIELALLRLTRPETSPDVDALTARIGRLEAQLRDLERNGVQAAPPAPEATSVEIPAKVARGAPQAEAVTELPDTKAEPAPPPTAEVPAGIDETPVAPQEPPPPDRTAAVEITLREFESIWPVIVARVRDELGARRHALLKEAVPASAEGGVVTLHLPSHKHFHLEQLQADDQLHAFVASTAADSLGGSITLAFGSADAAPAAAPPPPERAPDKEAMLEQGDDETDPAALVVDILGGEIISE